MENVTTEISNLKKDKKSVSLYDLTKKSVTISEEAKLDTTLDIREFLSVLRSRQWPLPNKVRIDLAGDTISF